MNIFFNSKFLFIFFSIIIFTLLFYRVNLIQFKLDTSTDAPIEKRLGTTGYAIGHIKDTFESWYLYNLYPVKKDVGLQLQKEISKTTKKNVDKNITIKMRDGSSIFQGEFYRLHYSLPSFLLNNKISPKTSNILLSIMSIILLMSCGFIKNKLIFSSVISLLLVFSDYYIYENYINENIFATGISIFLILFSIFYIFLENIKRHSTLWIIFIVFVISFFANVRTEFIFLLLSFIMLILFNFKIKKFIISLIIVLFSFIIFQNLLNTNFENKIKKTNILISDHNGIEYTGPIGNGHTFWHPFWMGLGDNVNGQNLGFNWGDKTAYDYVANVNPQLFKTDDIDSYKLYDSYDSYGVYQKKPELIPGYQETLRNDVINKFRNNQLEFFIIYKNKFINILTKPQGIDIGIATPLKTNRGYHDNVVIKGLDTLIAGVIISLLTSIIYIKSSINIFSKNFRSSWALVLASLPLALPAVIVSDMGATYISIFHFAIFALAIEFLISKLIKKF